MAFEPIDTTTHSREIEEQYQKVVKGDADTTWLIISPNSKRQYEPELVGTSFSEFLQSFEDSKVQYGLARVSPPGSDVQKLILIGWCPDSAPLKTRASFAQNFGVIANQVLKTYHVQVTARDEDDLDETELLMKISNSAGARYSIQQSQQSKKPSFGKPVGVSTAKKPVSKQPSEPVSKPAPTTFSAKKFGESSGSSNKSSWNDDGWDEPELEERDFQQKPLKPNKSSWKPVGKVNLQSVIAEENSKEDPRLVVSSSYEKKINPQSEIAKLKEESKIKRDAEYDKVLGTTKAPSSMPALSQEEDMVIKGFQNQKSPAQLWAEKKRQQQAAEEEHEEEREQEEAQEQEQQEEEEEEEEENAQAKSEDQEDVSEIRATFESLSTNEIPIIKPREPKAPKTEPRPEVIKYDPEDQWMKKKKFGHPLPGLHDQQRKDDSDGWSDEEDEQEEEEKIPVLPIRRNAPLSREQESDEYQNEAPTLPARKSASPVQASDDDEEEEEENAPSLPTRRTASAPSESEEEEQEQEPEDTTSRLPNQTASRSPVPPPAPRRQQPPKPEGPVAIAEYDYEAGEDNELTFAENDKIINIQFVDDDWWLGELESSGEKGLFPSNYVNLLK